MPELGIPRDISRTNTLFPRHCKTRHIEAATEPLLWPVLKLTAIARFGLGHNPAVLELSEIGITCPCTLQKRKKAHYCLCRLNLRRLGDYRLSTALLVSKRLFKVLQKGFSRLSRITAAASPMDSAFPKCSLTRAF